jgi:hypothetical protein
MRGFCLLILVLIAAALFAWYFIIESKITFAFKLTGLNIKGLGKSLLEGTVAADVEVTTVITNRNLFGVNLDELQIELYHKGELLGKSLEPSGHIRIKPDSVTEVSHWIKFYLSQDLFELLKAAGDDENEQPLEYVVRGRLFGIPVKFKNTANI